ncbi:uncharacterized protein UBRO_04069 [Ustilago bromivora]|uniref:Origin recognition complex subunit 2 n=1 Tax=Ustilago bromivora TaxID=307758 RepID=A0A1K0GPE3_9BASI|nr:uncharacterized protein UBRO_04069 [Ustilago bromivora]SYW81039.1 uncharacterized protein UBRO2_04071 [Ustilago bromivora]
MPRQPTKRRKIAQDLDVEGDEDWQSDELSSLPATDDEDSSASSSGSDPGSDSGSNSDEEDVIDMLKDPKGKSRASKVEVVIPLTTPSGETPAKRKRGRPPKEPEPKEPKKRGRPRKYAPGEKRPRRSRRKLNPDGSFKKRGRPKKVVDPDAVMMKVPKRRGRPPKPVEEGAEDSKRKRSGDGGGAGKRKRKREFDLLAGLDLEFDDEYGADIVPGVGGGGGEEEEEGWEYEVDSPRKQDDLLAKLRRRILYRQADAELQDFVDSLGPDGEPRASTSKVGANGAAAAEAEESVDEGPRPGLPLMTKFTNDNGVPSSEKRKERQPFEPTADAQSNGAMSTLAEAAVTAAESEEQAKLAASKPKGRPVGSKNRKPDWENNPLLLASRASNGVDHVSSLSLYGAPSAAASTNTSSGGSSLVKPTSSDAYFLFNTSKRARGLAGMSISTSSSLISSKLPALDSRNLERVVATQTCANTTLSDLATKMYRRLLPVYLAQLLAGYAIIFHGVGSKTKLLTELVSRRIEAEGDAVGVLAQGAMKGFKVEDMLGEIERAVGLGSLTMSAAVTNDEETARAGMVVSTLTAARAERVVRRFSTSHSTAAGPTKLFLILETFDAPGMQSLRFKSVLETLAKSNNIHIMATTEHVNSGFIAFTTGQQSSPPLTPTPTQPLVEVEVGKGRGRLCWIWQNMSTFIPSLDEMLIMRSNPAFASWMPSLPPALNLIGSAASLSSRPTQPSGSTSSISGEASGGVAFYNGLQVSDSFRTVSETSAISILKSVTTKARALFNLLAKQTLSTGEGEVGNGVGGVAYVELLNKAKRSFLVSNEADFKSLLIEFKDHHLYHISKQGVIGIGLADAKVLQSVLDRLKSI